MQDFMLIIDYINDKKEKILLYKKLKYVCLIDFLTNISKSVFSYNNHFKN